MRTLITPLFGLLAAQPVAQDIVFYPSPEEAMVRYEADGQFAFGKCVDLLEADTFYLYNEPTDKLEVVTEQQGPARHEYYADGTFYRRVEIQIEERVDTMYVEDIGTRAIQVVVQRVVRDLPVGAYSEYHPNGKIRLEGRLVGVDENGVPCKKGEWKMFDTAGELVAVETYE